jgi:NAD(P)-dependent dehydrogenase (short-subunit alcohol dehydrogenase family)
MSTTRFAGKVVFVAGSTGMAASAARSLAAEGAVVAVSSRSEEHLRSLAASIAAGDGSVSWHVADLSDEHAVDGSFRACVEQHGRIDALLHVAGISGRRYGDGLAHEASLDGWEVVMRTNATSAFLTTRAALRQMLTQEPDVTGQRGSILLMSSALARHPSAVHFATHAYAASKGAIESFTRAVAAAYAPHGIRVNAIAPSLVATPMSERAQNDPAIVAYLREKQPLAGGPIDADAITPVALHLLSADARMITGQVLSVDAGWSVSEPAPPRPRE